MAPEAMFQLGILILTLFMFFVMHNLRNQTTHTNTRTRNRTRQPQPNHHLAQASRHLARAESTTSNRTQHARAALYEADRALSIAPRDSSAHLLRARALDLLDRRAAALRSVDAALSSPALKFLSPAERADALVKRAELKVAVNRRRRVDSAVEDLVEAVGLSGESDNSEALCLLGKCYEWKGMKEEAKEAFQKVLDVEPDSVEALHGLNRLRP